MVISVTQKNQFIEDDLEEPVFFLPLKMHAFIEVKQICNQTETIK